MLTSNTGYGLSFLNITKNIVSKLGYYTVVFGCLLFIPFLGIKRGVMVIPGLLLGLFSIHNFTVLYWQYSFILVPGVILMFIAGIRG